MALSKSTIQKALKVKSALKDYFDKHPHSGPVPAKELMPLFISKGIFPSDHREGLPIRKLLRDLDEERMLNLIPYVIPERKAKNTNWFFSPVSGPKTINVSEIAKKEATTSKSPIIKQIKLKDRDEHYVIDLCDAVLETKASRQYTFDFLRGDPGKRGIGTMLPVDAFYEKHYLVIEYIERQHTEKVAFFDRRDTVSGVKRGEQRRLYDERRRQVLPKHGIKLIEISYTDFKHDSRRKIMRNPESDKAVIKKILKAFIE